MQVRFLPRGMSVVNDDQLPFRSLGEGEPRGQVFLYLLHDCTLWANSPEYAYSGAQKNLTYKCFRTSTTTLCFSAEIRCHTVKPSCSFSKMPAFERIERWREVALKESLISLAMSPTDALFARLRYFRIANRRLFARALRVRSSSFIARYVFYALIRTNMPIRERSTSQYQTIRSVILRSRCALSRHRRCRRPKRPLSSSPARGCR